MKFIVKKILAVVMCAMILSSFSVVDVFASEKSDGKNMEKVLKCFKKKQIKKLRQYNRKMSKYANEKCVKKMTSAMKSAYRKIVRSYRTTPGDSGEKYIWAYYFTDVDNDGKADLVMEYGASEADVELFVYRYKGGKAVKVKGRFYPNHATIHAYPGHNGLVVYRAVKNCDLFILVKIKNGRFVSKEYDVRKNVDDYIPMRCQLKSQL